MSQIRQYDYARAAVEVVVNRVVKPALRTPAGIRRVWALCQTWLHYTRQPVFAGGCFFIEAAAEFDARPGRVRDSIAAARRDWQKLYASSITEAVALGEISREVQPAQLAFELDAIGRAGAEDALLYDDDTVYERTSAVLRSRLRSVATDAAPEF